MCVTFNLQKGDTPFQLAVEKERSKIVKYFVEEIKVDTTLYDQVIIIKSQCNNFSYIVYSHLAIGVILSNLLTVGSRAGYNYINSMISFILVFPATNCILA